VFCQERAFFLCQGYSLEGVQFGKSLARKMLALVSMAFRVNARLCEFRSFIELAATCHNLDTSFFFSSSKSSILYQNMFGRTSSINRCVFLTAVIVCFQLFMYLKANDQFPVPVMKEVTESKQQQQEESDPDKSHLSALKDNYFLPLGYKHRMQPIYDPEIAGQVEPFVWQEKVYFLADLLAAKFGAKTIIDVGCGAGTKLANMKDKYKLICVDFGDNLRRVREVHPYIKTIEADLNKLPVDLFSNSELKEAVIIHADVIEHVIYPRPYLSTLGLWSKQVIAMLISTPDRELMYGSVHRLDSPQNKAHVREWTACELSLFLQSCGLSIFAIGHTETNTNNHWFGTNMAIVQGREQLDAVTIPSTMFQPLTHAQLYQCMDTYLLKEIQ
jgi:2-polyprenyl-3-methyl-5-hydroxy-6-metoxy-1,4-benzoquinol methylase